MDLALAGFKVAQRHLEAEVLACELDKRTNRLARAVRLFTNGLAGIQLNADDMVRN